MRIFQMPGGIFGQRLRSPPYLRHHRSPAFLATIAMPPRPELVGGPVLFIALLRRAVAARYFARRDLPGAPPGSSKPGSHQVAGRRPGAYRRWRMSSARHSRRRDCGYAAKVRRWQWALVRRAAGARTDRRLGVVRAQYAGRTSVVSGAVELVEIGTQSIGRLRKTRHQTSARHYSGPQRAAAVRLVYRMNYVFYSNLELGVPVPDTGAAFSLCWRAAASPSRHRWGRLSAPVSAGLVTGMLAASATAIAGGTGSCHWSRCQPPGAVCS